MTHRLFVGLMIGRLLDRLNRRLEAWNRSLEERNARRANQILTMLHNRKGPE